MRRAAGSMNATSGVQRLSPGALDAVPVFFLSDSTGISAETMGNALLIQFPDVAFERRLFPFITTVEEARRVVAVLDAVVAGGVTPLALTTAAVEEIRVELLRTTAPLIDFFELHMSKVEALLGRPGLRVAARLHGLGDVQRYNTRMAAVEHAIEHDDGASLRALDRADVVLVAPSRCGKTPTTMYPALQHGLFVANYPLVDEDFLGEELPRPVRGLRERCYGMLTTPARLHAVRTERRRGSVHASLEQCTRELRDAGRLFRDHGIPPSTPRRSPWRECAPRSSSTSSRDRTRGARDDHDDQHDLRRSGAPAVRRDGRRGPRGRQERLAGEMLGALSGVEVRVPDGFATTADAFRAFLASGPGEVVAMELSRLDPEDVTALAAAGGRIRAAVVAADLPRDLEAEVRAAYAALSGEAGGASVAVRSSATAEDLPDASFAGQQEALLNITGVEAVLTAVKEVFASPYNDRAISYRAHQGYAHSDVALSAGVQVMVRSDLAASGVAFTLDTESGSTDAVFITSAYGLIEGVVRGAVNPDEFYVYEPALPAGRPAILKRGVSAKATKTVHTGGTAVGPPPPSSTSTSTSAASASPTTRSSPAAPSRSRSTTGGARTSSGPRTAATACCTPSRRARRRSGPGSTPAQRCNGAASTHQRTSALRFPRLSGGF